jgi:hypothetical protein
VGYNGQDRGWDFFEQVIGRPLDRDRFEKSIITKEPLITREEALSVLESDIDRIEHNVQTTWPHYSVLDEVRQRVVLDMAFNLAWGLRAFVKTRGCVERQDWSGAVRQLWNSKWSTDVGDGPGKKFDRADRLTGMMLTGQDYTR